MPEGWVLDPAFCSSPVGRDAVKDALKPPDSLRVSRTQAQGRSRYPTPPDNFSERFRAERPEMCWLFDATNDGNAQVAALGLKRRFRALHAEGAIGPAKLRAKRDRGARLSFPATSRRSR